MTYERIQAYAYDNGKEAGIAEGITQGVLQGSQQKAVEDAKTLLSDGKYSAQEISELLNIPVEMFYDNK